jgi:hypothetical protein
MTLRTRNLLMFTDEGEFRVLVVECDSRRPRRCTVTRLALIPNGAVVTICVTGNTLWIESLIGTVRMGCENLLNVGVPDVLCGVTLDALQ